MPEIVEGNLVTTISGKMYYVLPEDAGKFSEIQPYGYTIESCKAFVIGGGYFPMTSKCPESGIQLWSVEQAEADELLFDQEILTLSTGVRQRVAPGWQPYAARKLKKRIEDAEADLRAALSNGSPQEKIDGLAAFIAEKKQEYAALGDQ